MSKRFERIMSMVLSFLMILTAMPVSMLAETGSMTTGFKQAAASIEETTEMDITGSVSDTTVNVVYGDTQTVTVTEGNFWNASITVTDTGIATASVNTTNKTVTFTGKSIGQTTATLTYQTGVRRSPQQVSTTYDINVLPGKVSVTLSAEKNKIEPGKSVVVSTSATFEPSGTYDYTVEYSVSSNATVAVDASDAKKATVTANAENTADVTVTAQILLYGTGVGDPVSATLTAVDHAIELDRSSGKVEAGKTLALSAEVLPAGAAVTWSSSDASVATVDANGIVTGVAPGDATITATLTDHSDASDTAAIHVAKAAPQVESKTMSIVMGSTVKINVSGDDEITFVSLNEKVVTVDENGNITPVKEGSAIISVSNDESRTYVVVTVNNVSITAKPTSQQIVVGETATNVLTIVASGTYTVTAVSGDPSVATVACDNKGIATITGISEGKTTVTYTLTSGDVIRTAEVEVEVVAADQYFIAAFYDDCNNLIAEKLVKIEDGKATVQLPTAPVVDNYDFVGWKKGDTLITADQDTITRDTEYTATYQLKSYTVSFISAYGTAPAEQTIVYGNTAALPTELIEDTTEYSPASVTYGNYSTDKGSVKFMGWYTQADGKGEKYTFDEAVEKDITLYAYWMTETVNIYFISCVGIKQVYVVPKGIESVTVDLPKIDKDSFGSTETSDGDNVMAGPVESGQDNGEGYNFVDERGFYTLLCKDGEAVVASEGSTEAGDHKWCYFHAWLKDGESTQYDPDKVSTVTETNVTKDVIYNALYAPTSGSSLGGSQYNTDYAYVTVNVIDKSTEKSLGTTTIRFYVTPQYNNTDLIPAYSTEQYIRFVSSTAAKFGIVYMKGQLPDSVKVGDKTYEVDVNKTSDISCVWLCDSGTTHLYHGSVRYAQCGGGCWLPYGVVNIYVDNEVITDSALLTVDYYQNYQGENSLFASDTVAISGKEIAAGYTLTAAQYVDRYTDMYSFLDMNWIDGEEQAQAQAGKEYHLALYYKAGPFDLKIQYLNAETGESVAETYTDTLKKGIRYTVVSPEVAGMKPDRTKVTGVMGAMDTELTVYYTVDMPTYTINYYLNGTTKSIKDSETGKLSEGSSFGYDTAPEIEGYTAVSGQTTRGTMAEGENVINILYYKNVTLTANSDTAKYDGTEHTVSGFTTEGTFDGYAADFAAVSVGASGTDANDYAAAFADGTLNTIDGNKYYIVIKATDGTLTITKRTVCLTSASDSKVYDGTPLTNDTVVAVKDGYDGFASGEGATYNVTGSQTTPDTSSNDFTYTLDANTKADNYTITQEPGTLTVTKANDLAVTFTGDTVKYDGASHILTAATDNAKGGETTCRYSADGGETWTSDLSSLAQTDAGTYTIQVEATNPNYANTATASATLTITKRTVCLTSASDSKVYDGTPLTNDTVIAVKDGYDGFLEGDGATYNVTGSQTTADTSSNDFTYTLDANTKAGNYEITQEPGTLTVTKADDLAVTFTGDTVRYDGTSHILTAATSNAKGGNTTYRYSADGGETWTSDLGSLAKTDAGTYTIQVVATNPNYANTATASATLTIARRTVCLTSASDSKVYDGTPLTNDTVIAVKDGYDGFATGEGATYNVTGSQTTPDTSTNDFTYTLDANTKADNYTITQEPGTLTVTKANDLAVTFSGDTVKYDGASHVLTAATDNAKGGETTIEYSADGINWTKNLASLPETDAGSYTIQVRATNPNYANTATASATLTITRRTVCLTSASDSKVYDGTPLTNDTVIAVKDGYDGFLEGEGATYNVTGSQTTADTSSNDFTYTLDANTKADNYTITQEPGTLTVTKANDLAVTFTGDTVKYDGASHILAAATSNAKGGNTTYRYSADGGETWTSDLSSLAQTDAGMYTIQVEAINPNYANTAAASATLTITKRTVCLTSASDSKVYDGTALTNHTVTAVKDGYDGFATGEGATCDVTGSQTTPDTSSNDFTYTLDANTKAGNYEITQEPGTLTVMKANDLTVFLEGDDLTYDGEAHTLSAATTNEKGGTTKLLYSIDGGSTWTSDLDEIAKVDAGQYTVQVKASNANYSNEPTASAQLNIAKKPVTITVADDGKAYGEDDPDFRDALIGEYVGDDLDDIDLTVTRNNADELVGEYPGVLGISSDKTELGNVYPNYVFTIIAGTFTITDENADPATKVHDNGEHDLGDTIVYTVTVVNIYNEAKTITLTEQDDAFFANGTHTMTFTDVASGETKTAEVRQTVTEADILNGHAHNTVDVAFSGIDHSFKATDDPDVAPKAGHLTVDKSVTSTPANGTTYALGEKITYCIRLTNDGNLTITDITLEDELTGDEWNFAFLAPGDTEIKTAAYTVTEEDIFAGTVVNTAVATGTSPDPDKPVVEPDPSTTEDVTDPVDPELSIDVTSDKEGKTTDLNGVITYTITVKNEGNVTCYNVVVKDSRTGFEETIAVLKPGEETEYVTKTTVTEADIHEGPVHEKVNATADPVIDPAAPEDPIIPYDEDGTEDKTVKLRDSLVVQMIVVSKPANGKDYVLGETITYEICARNDGNATLADVELVIDNAGPEGKGTSTISVDKLDPGSVTEVFTVTHVVTAEDLAQGDVENTVNGTGKDKLNGSTISAEPVSATDPVNISTGKINVNYVFTDGTQAADTVITTCTAGEEYCIVSPELKGYTSTKSSITGVMPCHDITITVFYLSTDNYNNHYIVIDDLGMPLGLGNISLNIGDCFE